MGYLEFEVNHDAHHFCCHNEQDGRKAQEAVRPHIGNSLLNRDYYQYHHVNHLGTLACLPGREYSK